MVNDSTVTISAGKLRLTLDPPIGGSIATFEWLGDEAPEPVMRRTGNALENVLDAACFPLVPYVNRIRGGTFIFRGRKVQLSLNLPGDASPLHGDGWVNPWTVEALAKDRTLLRYEHEAGEWPWQYEAEQELQLDENGLSARISCRNMSDEPMPCGLGFHPYFHCGAQTRLDTGVDVAWTIDRKVLPVEKVRAEGRYDLRDRLVCGQDLDNGFGGWSGDARMSDPEWPFDLRLTSREAKFFQVYSPAAGGIFVAEPVSHANAALNAPESAWPELGMRVLGPGERMELSMRLDVILKGNG